MQDNGMWCLWLLEFVPLLSPIFFQSLFRLPVMVLQDELR